MIINNIIIENFRCYYGKSNIKFNTDGKITLVYGDSGYGKSSLLQFFRWMFYGDPDFGDNNDKPLFNLAAYEECGFNDRIKVYGQIDFEHKGVSYSLHKSAFWSKSINPMNSKLEHSEYSLELDEKNNKGYVPYSGDVAEKINEILPKGLSKYFLLDGEKARDMVLIAKELKQAIYSLFGLDAYKNAISHIGTVNAKTSVLGNYAKELAKTNKERIDGKTVAELQDILQELDEKIKKDKAEKKEIIDSIKIKKAKSNELFQMIGSVTNKQTIEELIKTNNKLIDQHEQKIYQKQKEIGNLWYQWYPYLLLSNIASENSTVLREQKNFLADNYKDVFENLKKDLLKEIIEKNICVCGRALDEEAITKINGIINVMPPDSYIYQFGQFISKAKNCISEGKIEVNAFDQIMDRITLKEKQIEELEHKNQKQLDELKKFEDVKDLVEKLEKLNLEIEELEIKKTEKEGQIAQKNQVYELSNRKIKKVQKFEEASNIYAKRIKFFENLVNLLEIEVVEKEKQVKNTLNECVRDIFKKLTTQTEIDANSINFVDNDFSLRSVYLTGGQLAVDVYSYVIGIVKALQEFGLDNNENPIIIDAPFAFTGNEQSEHIFKTLPVVSKQTILLTLDLNKIKKLLDDTNRYDLYIIKNESQEKAKIERGEIDDIKF